MADDLCSPQVASGPLADLGYAEEVCFGDIPVDPELKTARRRSTTIGLTKDTYDSEEVRSDRMVSDSRHGTRRVGGDIVTEISPGAHADFMEATLGGIWTGITAIAAATNNLTLTPDPLNPDLLRVSGATPIDWIAGGWRIGFPFLIAGSGNDAIDDRLMTITGFDVAENEMIVTAPTNFGTAPVVVSAGTADAPGAYCEMGNIYRSFTFERAFTDIGSFIVYTGCRFNTMAVDLPPTGIATATYGVLGRDATPIRRASIDGVEEIVLDADDLGTLTFDAVAGTITAASGDFEAAGIKVMDRVIITGDGIVDHQNRNPRTVVKVAGPVLTVAEAIQTGGPYMAPFTVTRVGLPEYTAAPDESVLVAVSGLLMIDGVPAATVTALNFTIDNQMAGSEVVGSNVVPVMLFGNQCIVSGSMTVLFDRGGTGEAVYNAFDQEIDPVSIVIRLDNTDRDGGISFIFQRCKINAGSIGDAVAEGLPVSVDFRALKPTADQIAAGASASQIVIVDTAVVASADFVPAVSEEEPEEPEGFSAPEGPETPEEEPGEGEVARLVELEAA